MSALITAAQWNNYLGATGSLEYLYDRLIIVRKTANEIVNNSATLQNDDHLLLAIAANEIWFIDVRLLLNAASVNADWKFGWSVPTNCTLYWGFIGHDLTSWPWRETALADSPPLLRIATDTVNCGARIGIHGVMLNAVAINSANAGNINLQWSQSTATAEDNTILANSFLIAHKIG